MTPEHAMIKRTLLHAVLVALCLSACESSSSSDLRERDVLLPDTAPPDDATVDDTHAPDVADTTDVADVGDATAPDISDALDIPAADTLDASPDARDTHDPHGDTPGDTSPDVDQDAQYIGQACAVGELEGVCDRVSSCLAPGRPVSGHCPGSSAIQCCIDGDEDPYIGQPCQVDTRQGSCLHTADCGQGFVSTPGHCQGPADVQCCTEPTSPDTCDPDQMPRPNEGLSEAPGVGGCPPGMMPVDDFCIDRFEASLVEVLPGADQSWSPFFNPETRVVFAVSIEGAIPQGYIDGFQAAAACEQAGKRLCSSAEWLRVCQGPSTQIFPYGDTRQPGVCNDARSQHPAVEYFGASQPWVFGQLGHPCINQLPDSLALTGDHPGCVTSEGALDMMGNLHEWVSDTDGVFRGGYYVDTEINGPGCLYRTTAHNRFHWDYSTGFRCCF